MDSDKRPPIMSLSGLVPDGKADGKGGVVEEGRVRIYAAERKRAILDHKGEKCEKDAKSKPKK